MKIFKSVLLTIISFTLINLSYAEARSQIRPVSGDEILAELEQTETEFRTILEHEAFAGFDVLDAKNHLTAGVNGILKGGRSITLVTSDVQGQLERYLVRVVIDNPDHALVSGES